MFPRRKKRVVTFSDLDTTHTLSTQRFGYNALSCMHSSGPVLFLVLSLVLMNLATGTVTTNVFLVYWVAGSDEHLSPLDVV
jgi:hypothetical protein